MSNFFKDLKLVGKATATINAIQSELAQLQDLQKDTAEENELLLLQLHQVQEELEHYFLQYQDIKQQSEITQQRLNQVLLDNPNYFSYNKIECEPVRGKPERLHWTIGGLFGAGKYWEECRFDTVVEKDIAGFVFSRDADGYSPLTVWPRSCENEQEVVCIPTGTPENAGKRAEVLKTLSTSDWRLVTLLPEVLSSAINQNETEVLQGNKLIHALHKTREILLKHIPPTIRFDKVELVNALVHPGYEHLAFRLSNFLYGNRTQSAFEFRLGCANVTDFRFGSDPKLEFPLVKGKPQFESWYAESEDEFGPKLELRFALPDAMDLNVWNKLKPLDKKLISSLVNQLTGFIEPLHSLQEKTKRPSREWTATARDLRRILNKP